MKTDTWKMHLGICSLTSVLHRALSSAGLGDPVSVLRMRFDRAQRFAALKDAFGILTEQKSTRLFL